MLRGKSALPEQAQPSAWLPHSWEPSQLPARLISRLRAGVANVGHLGRLRRALSHPPLILAGLGSSVTADFGGVVGSMQDRFQLAYMGTPRRCRNGCVLFGWLLPIYRFASMNGTGDSALVNCGISARMIGNYGDCMHTALPEDADLIIVDGVNGMAPINGNLFKPTERLIRRLLALPRKPAVIILHWFDWCGCATCRGPRIERHRRRECYTADGLEQSYRLGRKREETGGWEELARHYRLPVLSIRRALHPSGTSSANGSAESWQKFDRFTWDGLHPRPCEGNAWPNCVYSMLVASMVNVFLDDVLRGRLGASKEEQEPLPLSCTTVRPGTLSLERANAVERCFAWGVERRTPPPIASNHGWRLTSTDTAWSFDPPAHCLRGRRNLTLPCPNEKPGLTAFAPGSEVVFNLPIAASNRTRQDGVWNATLHLLYLTSYEGMGSAAVRCERGCACEGVVLDAHKSQGFVSIWETHRMRTVLHGRSGACAVRVSLLDQQLQQNSVRSRSGTKFKIGGMTLRWGEGASVCAA